MIDGGLPRVDPRYRDRSLAERRLVELMEMCWEYDPDDRMSVFDAVDFLRRAVRENEGREGFAGGGSGDDGPRRGGGPKEAAEGDEEQSERYDDGGRDDDGAYSEDYGSSADDSSDDYEFY